jgi:hypothetical protein
MVAACQTNSIIYFYNSNYQSKYFFHVHFFNFLSIHAFFQCACVIELPEFSSEVFGFGPIVKILNFFFNQIRGKNGSEFLYHKEKFPKINDAKIKEEIFVGPHIRQIMKDNSFEQKLNDIEKPAWKSFVNVVKNCLGNHRAENYKDLINKLLISYKAMGCNMFLKIHILDSHLDYFPENLGAVGDEHGERFHQDISLICRKAISREMESWNVSRLLLRIEKRRTRN